MYSQAVPRFCVSVREIFSSSIDLTVINKFDKGAVMQISARLEHVYHVACGTVV